MKIPEEQKAEIIEGMVAMLDPEATETIEEIRKIPGRDLINLHEIYKTHDGHRVLPGIEYAVSCTETRKVNHRQKIGHIIADAANRDEMMANLGPTLG
jgi:formylmethanofuran dehydrogenase subunit B